MRGIYTYISEKMYVPREYSVAAILLLLLNDVYYYYYIWWHVHFHALEPLFHAQTN